jgi:hypothetical protein
MNAGQPLRALIQVSWTKHDRNVRDGSGAVAPTSRQRGGCISRCGRICAPRKRGRYPAIGKPQWINSSRCSIGDSEIRSGDFARGRLSLGPLGPPGASSTAGPRAAISCALACGRGGWLPRAKTCFLAKTRRDNTSRRQASIRRLISRPAIVLYPNTLYLFIVK